MNKKMKVLTFRGGIHPEYNKTISIKEPLREVPFPKVAQIALSQHIGAPNQPLVKKGDYVEEGQVLGLSHSFVSSPVHSPFFGKVLDIKKAFHPVLGTALSVFIERDENKAPKKYEEKDIKNLTSGQIIEKIRTAGIVGMGGAAFPTHVKLNVPEGTKIETLIINGAECEPYLTCDHVIMMRKSRPVLKGIDIIAGILNPKEIYIAIENNKKAVLSAFQRGIAEFEFKTTARIRIVSLKTKYPQGGEKQLIKAISKKEVPPGKLPLDIGFLVQNVGTVYAVYEGVCFDKPLIERIVTLSGDCLNKPGNYLIRIGTSIKDIIEQCKLEFIKKPEKMILGGPMMGIAQPHMDIPVLKNTSGILFLAKDKAPNPEENFCIRCAKCVDVCPVNLVPTEIMKNVKKQRWDEVKNLYVTDCMECGACAYVCPAKVPIVHYIKEGKAVVTAKHQI